MKRLWIIAFAVAVMMMLTGCQYQSDQINEYPRIRIDPSPSGNYIKFSLYKPQLRFDGYDVSDDGLTVTMHFVEGK